MRRILQLSSILPINCLRQLSSTSLTAPLRTDILRLSDSSAVRRLALPMGVLDQRFEKNFMITSVDYVFNWARKSAIWPLTFGLACCAIEMIASTTSRFDMARFGAEVFRPSPRQADLMIVAGTVTLKMAPVLKRVWDQMPDPKWCISMGACTAWVARLMPIPCCKAWTRSFRWTFTSSAVRRVLKACSSPCSSYRTALTRCPLPSGPPK